MSSFDVEKYVPTINSILRLSDLSTISAKRIRKALSQEFPHDQIAENKSILDKRILECFSKIQKEREGSVSEDDIHFARPSQDLLKSDLIHPSPLPVKRKSPPPSTSNAPAKRPKTATAAAPKVPKKDAYDSDADAKFAAELDQMLNSAPVRKTRGQGTQKTKPKAKKVKRKEKNGDEDGEVKKKKRAANPNNGFNAPLFLSPQLSAVVYESELSRPTVVKKLWEYIREHKLQNPLNKAEILCDDKFKALFNTDKIHMFTMNKVLSNHMWSKGDVVGVNSSSSTPKTSVSKPESTVPTTLPTPNRNGKHVKSEAVVKSDSEEEEEAEGNESEESRFTDSEDDR